MTLQEIKQHFIVEKEDDCYKIYSNVQESSTRFVYKYLCTAYKKGASFSVENKPYVSSITKFIKQVNEYVASLPYDSDYYRPVRLKSSMVKCFIIDLIEKHFGKSYLSQYDNHYLKLDRGYQITKIPFGYIVTEDECVIYIEKPSSLTSIRVKCSLDFADVESSFYSLFKPFLLEISTNALMMAKQMKNSKAEIEQVKIVNGFVEKTKLDIISELESLLNTLKND
jgi:hypothetical protein